MSVKNKRYKAKVQFTVEVNLNSVWGEGCTIEQIQLQAEREALALLVKACTRESVDNPPASRDWAIKCISPGDLHSIKILPAKAK